MKVLFLTEYSSSIGFGHLSRSSALAEIFQENDYEVIFLIRSWTSEKLEFPFKHYPVEWKVWQNLKLYKSHGDLCIIDTYQVSKIELNLLSKHIKYPISIADSRLNFPDKGLVIIGSIYGNRLSHLVPEHMDHLIGPDFIFFRNQFRNRSRILIKTTIKKVVISLGGILPETGIETITNYLLLRFKDIQITIVGNKQENQCCNSLYTGFLSTNRYIELLKDCDLMISNGGQTLNESILFGIPTIGISIAENQNENLKTWKDLGAITLGGNINLPSFKYDFAHAIDTVQDLLVRCTMTCLSSAIIDSDGTERVFKYLTNKIASD